MTFIKNDFPQPIKIEGYEADLFLTCCFAHLCKILKSCRCFSLSDAIFALSLFSGIKKGTLEVGKEEDSTKIVALSVRFSSCSQIWQNMLLHLKVILNIPHNEMNKMKRKSDASIVQYVFGDLADGILTLL